MPTAKYYISVISAFTIWGFFSVVLKSLDNFTAFDILSYRSVLSAAIMMVITLFLRPKTLKKSQELFFSFEKKVQYRIIGINILSGFFLALNWYIFIYVMNNVSVSATSLAYLICPILTMVLAYIILKEKLFKLQWFSVVLSLIGCLRSEERRVGKECRSRLAPYQQKKKETDNNWILELAGHDSEHGDT